MSDLDSVSTSQTAVAGMEVEVGGQECLVSWT